MNTERVRVDTRRLKSGMYRLRFRLSDEAYDIVQEALSVSPYDHDSASLDVVATNALAGSPAAPEGGFPATGRRRWSVRLYKDQYEQVRTALDHAGEFPSDADALVYICRQFIAAFGKSFAQEI